MRPMRTCLSRIFAAIEAEQPEWNAEPCLSLALNRGLNRGTQANIMATAGSMPEKSVACTPLNVMSVKSIEGRIACLYIVMAPVLSMVLYVSN